MTPTSVAVVVVNWNSGSMLRECLSHLRRQTVAPVRVIVVDNASTDGSLENIDDAYAGVEAMRFQVNMGFAAASNRGVLEARQCKWVALLNPDAFPEPDWIEALLHAALNHQEFSFFGSQLLRAEDPTLLDGTGDIYHVSGLGWRRDHGCPARTKHFSPTEIFSPCAAAALYERDVFLSANGFDESYFCYFEDMDLGFRLRLRGHRALYVPTAVVRHIGSASTGRNSDFTVYYGHRNLVWTFVKNMPGFLLWQYLFYHLIVNIAAVIRYSLSGRPGVILSAKFDAMKGLSSVLADRKRVQAKRRVSRREIKKAMTKGLCPLLRRKLCH
jgi:GT2 family glycosyltransferase